MITGIDHIEIIVTDLEEHVRFYRKLGFEVLARTVHHGGSVELKLPGDNQTILELHEVIGQENPGINHIGFRCNDVSAAYQDLKSRGLAFTSEPHEVPSTGRTNTNLRDPSGFRLQLVDESRGAWESRPRGDTSENET